jgi:hypothetical protein
MLAGPLGRWRANPTWLSTRAATPARPSSRSTAQASTPRLGADSSTPMGITSPTGPWIGQPPLPPGHVVVPLYGVHTVVIGGMPGWQIALIAAGAALCAAIAAVLVYRAWTTRRKPVTAAA